MMQRILILFFLVVTSLSANAQVFRYIGIEDGLSSRRVLSIEQGVQDYIWILTHKGVDRYDGKYFIHYNLNIDGKSAHFYPDINHITVDSENTLWEYGKDGYVFKYDEMKDQFVLVFNLRANFPALRGKPITATFLDSKQIFWFCCENELVQYDAKQDTSYVTSRFLEGDINCVTEGENGKFFFATNKYIYQCSFQDKTFSQNERISVDNINLINYIYFHKETDNLIISTLLNGLYLYDFNSKEIINLGNELKDVGINTIKPYYKNPNEVLIATDGSGVYKLNLRKRKFMHFLKENYEESNKMNGSIVKDICIDKANRIWNVIYPTGITIYSEKYESYKWIKHTPTEKESLVDNRINAIIEDSEGDIWFGTCNGISCYYSKENKWKTYLSEGSPDAHNANRIFISLCESTPGVILAGGYMSGTYRIQKHSGKVDYVLQSTTGQNITPDKYIRSIFRDKNGTIWGGGYYSLRNYDPKTQTTQLYHTTYPITLVSKKDDNFLWIGTINGLYTFDRTSKNMQKYPLSDKVGCVNAIYQSENDSLTYIATYGNGLYVIDNVKNTDRNFNTTNCGLTTNNVYSIIPNGKGDFFLGTDNGLVFFDISEHLATHWTKEQGLLASSFNQNAAIHTRDGKMYFGSDEGAIVIADNINFPRHFSSHMIFENLNIMFQAVHPKEEGSPLDKLLNETTLLNLSYNQNTFSFNVSSINYDNPSNILYSWKLEGFYDQWTEPSTDNLIRYTNLSPGNYTLKVRAYLLDNNQFLEEKCIQIIVGRPYWLIFWAFLVYALILCGTIYALLRYQVIKKDRLTSQAKINFFIHTAHDIRTPLTLIKAPLGEILMKEQLSDEGLTNLNLAIQNTDNLSELANNLMNFQKEELYSSKVVVEKEELNHYIQSYLKHFESYAEQKELTLKFNSSFETLEVWIDRNKMDSILRNLISNALKYTPIGGAVTIETSYSKNIWSMKITDTGIGIPQKDQKKLFKFLFRGKNVTNQLIAGSGVGMLLTYRLIQNHQGKITFNSKENAGTSFLLSFPIWSKHYSYKEAEQKNKDLVSSTLMQDHTDILPEELPAQQTHPEGTPRILVVEDNTSLRLFLVQALSDTYITDSASNGAEALKKTTKCPPDLILSDVMMPIMDGHEMCRRLKNNMETSHIPIILLTALNDKEHILDGLKMRADRYIVKPFDLSVLKANISNVLENRNLLRHRLQKTLVESLKENPPVSEEEPSTLLSELDDEFIQRVTQLIKDGLSDGLNVDTLCAAVNMSRTSFYNKIKALTGIAPAELIRNIRMQEAGILLKSKRYSVSEVSQLLGFADPKYFTDTFKKHYGVTPSTYMKQETMK